MQCNKTLAFYIRLSAEDADLKSSGKAESNSVTNQRKLLRDYYEQHTELREYEVIEFATMVIPAQILTDHNSCL